MCLLLLIITSTNEAGGGLYFCICESMCTVCLFPTLLTKDETQLMTQEWLDEHLVMIKFSQT